MVTGMILNPAFISGVAAPFVDKQTKPQKAKASHTGSEQERVGAALIFVSPEKCFISALKCVRLCRSLHQRTNTHLFVRAVKWT